MKKLILMTSALTLVGSAAFAEIKVTGEASVSYGNWETGNANAKFDFGTKVDFALEETAGAYTYGAKLTVEDGKAVSQGVIWVSGGFGKVSFGIDEFDELNAKTGAFDAVNGTAKDNDYGDIKYEGNFRSVGVVLVADAGLGWVPVAGTATWDLGLKYSGGTWNVALDIDSTNAWELSGDVAFGNYTVGAAVKDTNAWDIWAKTSFGAVNAKFTADSASVYGIELDGTSGAVEWKLAGDSANAVSASVKYTSGDLSVKLAYDNEDAGDKAGCSVGGACNATLAGANGVDYGDEADVQLTIGYKVDMLDFEVKMNDVSEYEISMTAGFEF